LESQISLKLLYWKPIEPIFTFILFYVLFECWIWRNMVAEICHLATESPNHCSGVHYAESCYNKEFKLFIKFASRCSPRTFRCSYGACVDLDYRCDGRPHCADSSDEGPVLCGNESKPTCRLPKKPEHGNYKILNCQQTDTSPFCLQIPDTIAPDSTILMYQCDAGYNLEGPASILCIEAQWSNSHPTCVSGMIHFIHGG
jgi:hypothetical protein